LLEEFDQFKPTFPFNKLITKKVWNTFLKDMDRASKGTRIKDWYPENLCKKTPAQLNSGECHYIAWAINKVFPQFKIVDTDDYRKELRDAGIKNASDHAFVEYKGKFYDVEAPNGVSHPAELPFYKRFMDRKSKRKK